MCQTWIKQLLYDCFRALYRNSPIFRHLQKINMKYIVFEFLLFMIVVIVWQLDLQLPVQSVPITTKVVSLNPVHGEMYLIQHYVIKFVSDLWQVGGFLRILRFPPINKTDRSDKTEILLKVALNTISQNLTHFSSVEDQYEVYCI